MILQVLIAMMAGWINRHQQHVITYLKTENQVLKAKLPKQRLRLTDTECRRLAALAHPLGRQQLKDTATIATPDTLMRWYQRLIANKFDGSHRRKAQGRPRVDEASSSTLSAWPLRIPPGGIAASKGLWRISAITSTRSPCATFYAGTISILLQSGGKAACAGRSFANCTGKSLLPLTFLPSGLPPGMDW